MNAAGQQAWREANPDKYPEYIARRRAKARSIRNEAKDVPCMDCGVKYPPYVMDFDHRDGATKVTNVGRLAGTGAGPLVVLAEIAKCDVVCANCHRVRTQNRKAEGW